jgi:hypothetical protein
MRVERFVIGEIIPDRQLKNLLHRHPFTGCASLEPLAILALQADRDWPSIILIVWHHSSVSSFQIFMKGL